MKTSPNIKKVRSVIITIVLVAATNFAISHAESVTSLTRFDGKSAFYATDAGNLPPAPRPVLYATDAGNLPPATRPVLYATDAGNLPPAPRPVM